jgi:hypothetical protein
MTSFFLRAKLKPARKWSGFRGLKSFGRRSALNIRVLFITQPLHVKPSHIWVTLLYILIFVVHFSKAAKRLHLCWILS